jgi:Holliday junction resolvase RusA-like endonuclease|tara:strand:+ start:686 stop:1015 length:330 start_codon:yes stop_codon:yes gene_type:complete
MTVQLHIPALSINECWQGKRFKTKKYKAYEKQILLMLPRYEIPEGKLAVKIEAGFQSAASDLDNIVKPILDILQKRYGFNDNRIYSLELEKKVVGKGSGYFNFNIEGYT